MCEVFQVSNGFTGVLFFVCLGCLGFSGCLGDLLDWLLWECALRSLP